MRDTPNEATQKYLGGINWPAQKEEVLRAIEANGAPQDVIEAVQAEPKQRLVSPADFHQALWNVLYRGRGGRA